MKNNNIQYDRFNAINGSNVNNDHRLSDYCNTFCTDGMKGCALSHRSIWELMIKNGYKNVLVFEDDAVIDDNFDRDFHHVWNHLPKDFDIIYFGCLFGCSDNSITNNGFKKISGFDSEDINEFIQTNEGSVGTHCYMISLEGAKKFIDKPINFHIDTQIMAWIKTYNYNAYSTNKNMAETSQENSSLSDTYPIFINSILKQFKLNNLKIPSTLDWCINENFLKLGPYNINLLLTICFLIVFCIPTKYAYIVYIWLFIEFIISKDIKNSLRYTVVLSISIFLKYLLYR